MTKMKETVSLAEVKEWCESIGAKYYFHLGHNITLPDTRNLRNTHDLFGLLRDTKELYEQTLLQNNR